MAKKVKYIVLLLLLIVVSSLLYFFLDNKFSNEINIYVSTDGLDLNTGDKKSPLNTIQCAKNRVRVILQDENLNKKVIKINLRKGVYYIDNTLFFNDLDCKDGITIIYTSYKNENVILTSTPSFNNNNKKFIILNNANNIIFKNLTIQHTLSNSIEITKCDNIQLSDVILQNSSEEL